MDEYTIQHDHRGWYIALNGDMHCACTTSTDAEIKLKQFQYWASLLDNRETFKANDSPTVC